MARRKPSVTPTNELQVLLERMRRMETEIRALKQAKMSSVQTVSHEQLLNPAQGMTAINWPHREFCFYHDGEWICLPMPPTHAIKVFGDRTANRVEDGAFRFDVEPDLDGRVLYWTGIFNGTAGTTNTSVQISNQTRGLDMLTSNLIIPGGSTNSFATPPSINMGGAVADPNHMIHTGDTIWVDVDGAGTGAKGLGIYMTFIFTDPGES